MLTVKHRNAIILATLLLVLLATLVGCASTPTVREIPIPVSCIKSMPLEPTIELDALPLDAPLDDQVRALLIDTATLQSSLKEARALMAPCLIP